MIILVSSNERWDGRTVGRTNGRSDGGADDSSADDSGSDDGCSDGGADDGGAEEGGAEDGCADDAANEIEKIEKICKLRSAVYPPNISPIGVKLGQNTFQMIPDI